MHATHTSMDQQLSDGIVRGWGARAEWACSMECIGEISFGDRKNVGDSSSVNRWSISPCKAKLANVDLDRGRLASNVDLWSAGVSWNWVIIVKSKHQLLRTDLIIAVGWGGAKNQPPSTKVAETDHFKGHEFQKKTKQGVSQVALYAMQTNWWEVCLNLNAYNA